MKKKISLLLCILSVVLCFTACGGKKEEADINTATMEQVAEVMISSFSQMDDAVFEQLLNLSEFELNSTLMNAGLPIDADDFRVMIEAWQAGEDECGAYASHGDFEVQVKNSGVVLTAPAEYANRKADIAFSFTEKGRLKSIDVSAKFTMGEILSKAGLNTVLGMGTVFAVLIFLAFLIYLMQFIPKLLELGAKKETAPAADTVVASSEVAEAVADESDDLELVAVITAAIAAQEGTSTDSFVVRSIKRRPSNHWA